jgi:hypothetical protein
MKKLLCAALCVGCALSLAAQEVTDTGALTLLDLKAYSSYFLNKRGWLDDKYIMVSSDEDLERVASLSSKVDDIDTPLEISLLSYAAGVIDVRPAGADAILPANNPRLSGLKLGSAVLKELAGIRFFASNPLSEQDRNTIGRYEGMIKFISDRNGVSRAICKII